MMGAAGESEDGRARGAAPAVDPDLEVAYNGRAAVPDHAAFVTRWREASLAARTRDDIPRRLDLAYGRGPRQTLDLFGFGFGVPTRPLLIFLHGGDWQAMDKGTFSFLAPPFVEAGAAVAILNYPLCPDVPLDIIAVVLRGAIQMLWREAATLGVDRRRFVIAGHAAGGHLVAEMLCTRWPRLDRAMPVDSLRGGIAVSGVFDLEPLTHTSLNAALGLTEAAARRNSPLFRDPVPGTSLTLAVGGLESDAVHAQSARLARGWAAMGAHETWIPLPGRHQFSALDALVEIDHPLFHDALARLGLSPRARDR